MKAKLLGALMALLVMMVAGCGLVSGTVFVSQAVDGTISAQSTGPLDEVHLAGSVVDLTGNSDLEDIDVDGIEDLCVVTHVENHGQALAGEIWVTASTNDSIDTIDEVRSYGFPVFEGLLLPANGSHDFTCEETLQLFNNLDQLAALISDPGIFKVWAIAEEGQYDFEFSNIYLGMHVTGSL